jgi:D-serine deaminase-like pyridoxal phosphate-dependent protein
VINIESLPTPALLLDLDVLEANLARMSQRAEQLGVALRPHIKTHKCIEIAEMQRLGGIVGLTVSTLYEARVFADSGFSDLTWAFPLILSRLPEAIELAARSRLGLVIDSDEALAALSSLPPREAPLHVWIKVDCGYHRAGVNPEAESTVRLAGNLASHGALILEGILSHSGNAYHGQDGDEIAAIAEQERAVMVELAERLRSSGIEVRGISVGSTPAMTHVRDLDGVTEARPGNYALFDDTQRVLGSCTVEECAATVLASVVSCQSGHSVIDAGALALSKDSGSERADVPSMGRIFRDPESRVLDPDLRVVSVSQEHGIVNHALAVGSKVRILPNHSCLTVACFDEYQVVRGDVVVDHWKIWRGR